MTETMVKGVRTPALEIAYEESGPAEGPPVVLLHGFPDDVRAYDGVAPALAAAGWRVLVPYLRGYGPTRFLDSRTPRSGQQAALGGDLKDFLDALGIERASLAGYDWAAVPPASSPHYGRNASPHSSRSAATTCRTSPDRASPRHPIANIASGTSGISTPSVAEPVWRQTGSLYAAVGTVVAELAVRRCDLRADRGILR
jgi:pimeloyl-ACP methyl ester carboxylesterase